MHAGTIEYATMTTPLPAPEGSAADSSTSHSPLPSFHGADASNYRAPAEAAALSLGRRVEFEATAVKPGGCVVHAQDCWHGSAPNVSAQRHRRALVVHFLRGDARFIDGHSLQVTAVVCFPWCVVHCKWYPVGRGNAQIEIWMQRKFVGEK